MAKDRTGTSKDEQSSQPQQEQGGESKGLLQRAHETIVGARQQDYGDKLQNFSQIAMIWQGVLAHKLMPGTMLTPEDVATLMIGMKLARLAKSPDHFDSWLDVAGYAGCASILQDERKEGKLLRGATTDSRTTYAAK